jgi:hypothetical protein
MNLSSADHDQSVNARPGANKLFSSLDKPPISATSDDLTCQESKTMTDGSLRGATRSRITNDPLRRGNGRTTGGRRLRDLFRGLMQCVGDPDDVVVQADVLPAAELRIVAEDLRCWPVPAMPTRSARWC